MPKPVLCGYCKRLAFKQSVSIEKIMPHSLSSPVLVRRIRERRFGVVEICEGALHGIRFRPWPTRGSRWGVWWGERMRRYRAGDRFWLYYNQPWGSSDYLSISYAVGGKHTSYASLRHGLAVLDEIARLKQSDALVCEVANAKISERFIQREGWVAHLPEMRSRHYIKRFYGEYPPSRLPELTRVWRSAAAASSDGAQIALH